MKLQKAKDEYQKLKDEIASDERDLLGPMDPRRHNKVEAQLEFKKKKLQELELKVQRCEQEESAHKEIFNSKASLLRLRAKQQITQAQERGDSLIQSAKSRAELMLIQAKSRADLLNMQADQMEKR